MREKLLPTLCSIWMMNSLRKKLISAFLAFAIALVTVTPPQSFAQTQAQPATAPIESHESANPAKPRSDLGKSLAAEVAKVKAGPLTEAGIKRLEQDEQNQQSGPPPKSGLTRKNKIFLTLMVVLLAGAIVVAIKHRCKDQPMHPCPVIDDSTDSSDY